MLTNFVLYALSGVMSRWLGIKLSRYIAAHSDGGGWDSGTDFSFYLDLPEELSKNHDGYFGSLDANTRVRGLLWFLSAVLAPIWWALLFIDMFPVITWCLADKAYQTYKSNYHLYEKEVPNADSQGT